MTQASVSKLTGNIILGHTVEKGFPFLLPAAPLLAFHPPSHLPNTPRFAIRQEGPVPQVLGSI